MTINFILLTAILALLWSLTILSIYMYYQKRLAAYAKNNITSSDILLSMISEKYAESYQATQKLTEVANFLKIGLIEYKNNTMINLNDIKKVFNVDQDIIDNITKETDITLSSPKTLIYNNLAFQINYLKITDNHYVILIQDVSETYFMALKLKESEKFAILGQITAQMAHQLKTQLAILAGKAQLLSKKFADSDQSTSQNINEIFLQAREISEKINKIVSIYKQKNISKESFDINQYLIELKNETKPLHPEINIMIDSAGDFIINTDINILKNIIFLITQNSLHPQTQTSELIFSLYHKDNKKILQITDNGTGISETIKDKIFQPFYTTKDDGMGLGLFLAKDLANLINIEIINDDIPKGSQFRLIIPEN